MIALFGMAMFINYSVRYTLFGSTGIYVDTLQTDLGCDSIVTMDMTINYSIQTTDSLREWNGTLTTLVEYM